MLRVSKDPWFWIGLLVFFVALYFPLFLNLDRLSIRMWDESRNAVNALEMALHGNYFIRHFNGIPDHIDLNPPFFIWFQALSLKLFGYNELSIRLISPFSILGIIAMIIVFLKRETGKTLPGFFAGLVIVCSLGVIHRHIARTGDHDAFLTMLLTGAGISHYYYLKSDLRAVNFLVITSVLLFLSVFTKSVIGFITLPALLLFTLYEGKLIPMLKQGRTYASILSVLTLVIAYYAYRESADPGYLDVVWNEQLVPRYTNNSTMGSHKFESFWYYLINFYEWRFTPWIVLLPFAFYISWKRATARSRKVLVLALMHLLTIFLVISSGTKNLWYDAQLFPFMSIILGLGLYAVYDLVQDRTSIPSLWKMAYVSLFTFSVFFIPYYKVINEVYKPHDGREDLQYGNFIKTLAGERPEIKSYTAYFKGYNHYNAHLNFYTKVYNEIYGYAISNDFYSEEFAAGDTIMFCESAVLKNVHEVYLTTLLAEIHGCQLLLIKGVREIN
ncbi:MAG: glycosyltransferase family 39 protein [Vicingaceae bacterium]